MLGSLLSGLGVSLCLVKQAVQHGVRHGLAVCSTCLDRQWLPQLSGRTHMYSTHTMLICSHILVLLSIQQLLWSRQGISDPTPHPHPHELVVVLKSQAKAQILKILSLENPAAILQSPHLWSSRSGQVPVRRMSQILSSVLPAA